MHIISRKKITEFCQRHPEAQQSLDRWYRIIKRAEFNSFADVKSLFPSADKVKNFVVFNVGGNQYRVIVYIRYRLKRLFIRYILTHKEYDRDKWKEDEWFKNIKK